MPIKTGPIYKPEDHPIEVRVGKPSRYITAKGQPVDEKAQVIRLKRKHRPKSGNPSTKV